MRFPQSCVMTAVLVLSVSVSVLAQGDLSCHGFDSPFDDIIGLSKKTNRAIPLRAQLFDSANNPATSDTLSAPPVVNVTFRSSSSFPYDVTSLLVPLGQASEGNQFNFDPGSHTWWFNLGTTPFSAPGTYTVTIRSGDSRYPIGNAGQNNCQAVYFDNVGSCQDAFDPINCGNDASCQETQLQLRAQCIVGAGNARDGCKALYPSTAGTACYGQFVRP